MYYVRNVGSALKCKYSFIRHGLKNVSDYFLNFISIHTRMVKPVLILVWNGPWIGSLNCTSASNSWHVSCFHVADIYIYIYIHTVHNSVVPLSYSLCVPPPPKTFSCPQRYFDSFESGLMKHFFGVLEECRLERECLRARNALKYKRHIFILLVLCLCVHACTTACVKISTFGPKSIKPTELMLVNVIRK